MQKKSKNAVVLLGFAALIFFVLYRRFLFGNAVYLFKDVGSDSMSSSYPILVMLSRLFHAGDFSAYTLSSGLGSDTSVTFLQYLNPLKGFLLFFGRDTMPYALLMQLLIGHVICAYAAYRYLLLMTGHGIASVIGALLFAYSSYSVLWSENLSYGICLTMFALTMWAVEAFIRKRTGGTFLLLTGVLALYLVTNYFFCYMTALFVIGYLILRAFFAREKAGTFFRQFFGTGISAVFALMISGAAVAAIAGTFLGSVRTGDATRPLASFLKKGVDVRMLFACVSRLFSENLAGIGDAYWGPDNYYEIAALFVGVLFFFAFFYLLYKKETRIPLLITTALCAAALLLPVCRYILNLNWLCMRFSYWICFLECIAVTFFLRDLLTGQGRRRIIFAVLTALAAAGAVYAALFIFGDRLGFTLSVRTARFSAVCFALFAAGLILAASGRLPSRLLPALILLAVFGEIVVMHHDTLYLREYVTWDRWQEAPYSSAVYAAANSVAASDGGLYRISSADDYLLANEGLVDGYNGTTLYNNTNPKSLSTLAFAHGTNEVSTPYFMSGYEEYGQFTLLGGKYLIRKDGADAAKPDEALFEKKESFEQPDGSGTVTVYENRNALPFGYLCREQISEESYLRADLPARMHLLGRSWYLTGEAVPASAADESASAIEETDSAADEAASAAGGTASGENGGAGDDRRIDLFEEAVFTGAHNVGMKRTSDGAVFTVTGEDPYIYVFYDKSDETDLTSNYLYLNVSTTKSASRGIALYYLQEKEDDPAPDKFGMVHYNKYYPESLTLLPDRISGFRFDLDDQVKSVTVTDMQLIRCSDPSAHFADLAATGITGISFDHDTYNASVSAPEGGMLCVPFLYSTGFSATVNGKAAPVLNINGGLCGILLDEGDSLVEMRYTVPHFRTGLIISAVSVLLYAAASVFIFLRKRKGHDGRRS